MLKYVTTIFLPHHMNFVLVESWDAFNVSAGNIIRDVFVKKSIPPLRPPGITTNIQACAASIQVSYGYKAEEINEISRIILAPIYVEVTRTDVPMVVL